LDGEEIEVITEMKYLSMMLDRRGKWDKERKQVLTTGKIALTSKNISNKGAKHTSKSVRTDI
jgi:hypothetical protein